MPANNDDPLLLKPVHEGSPEAGEAVRGSWADVTRDLTRPTDFVDVTVAQEQKSIVDYLRAILYRKWTVTAVFLITLAATGLYAYTRTPIYRTQATIEVEKVFPTSSNMAEVFNMFGQFEVFYQTQLEALKSRSVAEAFLRRFSKTRPKGPQTAEESSSSVAKPDQAGQSESDDAKAEYIKAEELNSLLSRISVNPIKGTQMIEITLEGDNPILIQRMLREYLAAYSEEAQRKRTELADKVRMWLKNELSLAERTLRSAEAELMAFTKEHGILPLDRVPRPALGYFEKATDSFMQAKTARVNAEAREYDKEKVLPSGADDQYVRSLKSQLASLRAEYTSLGAIYSPEYFKMALLRNKMQTLEKAIEEIEKKSAASALETAKKKEESAAETYDKFKKEAMKASSLNVQYEILKRIVDANGQMYVMLLQRSKQAELDHGLMGHNVSISSSPTLPLSPIKPNKSKILVVGAILGLLGGIAVALALEQVDKTVQTTDEIKNRLNLTVLGAIPRISDLKEANQLSGPNDRYEFLAHRFPASPFTDAIRIVQNSASTLIQNDTSTSICVSSALPLEGKTLIAIGMGTVTASEHKNVLIVDGDLRRPRLHHVFNGKGADAGLSDLITGRCTELKDAVRQSHVPGLYYMTAGTITDNPVALLKTMRIKQILDACKKVFDMVIVDAPPVLGLVDARILGSYCDGLILVARAGHTSLEIVRQAKDAVFQGQSRLLGIVLNMAARRDGSYSYYNSRYYYHRKDD